MAVVASLCFGPSFRCKCKKLISRSTLGRYFGHAFEYGVVRVINHLTGLAEEAFRYRIGLALLSTSAAIYQSAGHQMRCVPGNGLVLLSLDWSRMIEDKPRKQACFPLPFKQGQCHSQ